MLSSLLSSRVPLIELLSLLGSVGIILAAGTVVTNRLKAFLRALARMVVAARVLRRQCTAS